MGAPTRIFDDLDADGSGELEYAELARRGCKRTPTAAEERNSAVAGFSDADL